MNRKKVTFGICSFVLIGLVFFGWRITSRSAYETAEYVVLQSEGQFDVRQYPDLMLVTTQSNIKSQGGDNSFMRLFNYISGANDSEQKISMTTPVFMKDDALKKSEQMGFVLPSELGQQSVPQPSNEQVHIQKRTGGRFAVIRFSGQLNDQSISEAEQKLRQWIKDSDLVGAGGAEHAGYDPPWTPGPLRRNEVLVRLE